MGPKAWWCVAVVSIFLAGCGGGGSSESVKQPIVKTDAARPTITLTANPANIVQGQSITLSWTSSNASSVTLDNGIGAVGPIDSLQVTPAASTTYTATAVGSGGTATALATVTVAPKPQPNPTITLTGSPGTISAGKTATLTWTSSNASSVTIDHGIGSMGLNDSIQVSPTATTKYTATAMGPAGTTPATSSFTITVDTTPRPVTITANPSTIDPGEATTLTWTSSSGTSAQIDSGVGPVALNGSFEVSPSVTKTFTITVTTPDGPMTDSVTVNVSNNPIQTASPLKHVIVVLMQNNSFDHLFGKYPAQNGNTVENLQHGVPGYTQVDAQGTSVSPFLLTDISPPALPEGDSVYPKLVDGGKMDKFAYYDGDISMGYYDDSTPGIITLWNWAKQFALTDHYFGSVLGEAPSNQLYLVAAADQNRTFSVQPAYGPCQKQGDSIMPYTFPNIANQLSQKQLGWAAFEENFGQCSNGFMGIHNPFQYFTSTHDSPNNQDYSNLNPQIQNDILPGFSLVIPSSHNDMHPGNGSITNGIDFLKQLVQQVQSSPVWKSTAIIITFDTGGGWYDHVAPPTLDNQGLAFRVPTLVISPYAKKNYVSNAVMDHVSVLKLIQWNWGLPSLNARNSVSGDMLDLFDFTQIP